MGVDLTSESGKALHMQWDWWGGMLKMAFCYGWEPMGTLPPDSWPDHYEGAEVWSGTYFSNSHQTVRKEDALGLAYALQRTLDDPSWTTTAELHGLRQTDRDWRSHRGSPLHEYLDDSFWTCLLRHLEPQMAPGYVRGRYRDYPRDFVVTFKNFLCEGAFQIA
jgi:hypothetical protein